MTDPAVTVVFFSLAFLAACAAGAAWEHWHDWKDWDRQRRSDRLARRRSGTVTRIAAYTGAQKPVADTFPLEWAKDAAA